MRERNYQVHCCFMIFISIVIFLMVEVLADTVGKIYERQMDQWDMIKLGD